jgi:hypothetical protein
MQRLTTLWLPLCLAAWAVCATPLAATEPAVLRFLQTPRDGLVIARVESANLLVDPSRADRPLSLQAVTVNDRRPVPAQFIPDPVRTTGADGRDVIRGLVLLQLPAGPSDAIRLSVDGQPADAGAAFDGTITRAGFVAQHRAAAMGGLPHQFRFPLSGKDFSEFAWNDRVHHNELGGFLLRNDQQAQVELLSEGPICSVVRVQAAYKRPDGTQPPSRPRAVYHWYYFHQLPLIFVTATITQEEAFRWQEVHFLELNFPGRDFERWVGDTAVGQGELVGDNSSHRFQDWAAVTDQRNGIGMFGGGRVVIYDGRGGYGTYLHADADRAWQPWEDMERTYSAWLWVGTDEQPATVLRSWQQRIPATVSAVLSPESVHRAIAAAGEDTPQYDAGRGERAQHVAWATRLEMAGRFDDALAALAGTLPADWKRLSAGDLQLAMQQVAGGVRLQSLFDSKSGHEHAPAAPPPLFRITLLNTLNGQQRSVVADAGWGQTQMTAPDAQQLEIRWEHCAVADFGELAVVARAVAQPADQAIRWTCEVSGQAAPWSVSHVVFPQLGLVAPGNEPVLLFPRGPGELQRSAWRETFSFAGTYPSGWMSMQFMAAYDQSSRRGLYWAVQDPLGSTKDLSAASDAQTGVLVLSADHPVPDMRQPGNRFALSGTAVWQAFSGDWFDAAQIYRRWVRAEARWFPQLSSAGREDTPLWMRELCAWAQTGGDARQCVEPVRQFAEFLGVPAGFHWYSWHRNPFDNDYPHYFPTTDGFTEGVARLQDAQVHVMPYINGRLWDTRDRGVEDFEFSRRALPAATKNEKGEPFTESYGSKESDGSSVKLAVMCPATTLWQDEVRSIVLQLFNDHHVHGVYIDQIAAASPVLCMDPQHGHPLGGGAWWNEGYWQMLDKIRREKPAQCMLTTECNGEPFIRWFDGYLTWHWQYDGQVPAFPAIYGGAVQMFGRAYRGGSTKDLALRMKAGQQWVFGEQIGWLDPHVIQERENADFLRQLVRLRWQLRRYFYAGQMLRPPQFDTPAPIVRADWQWQDQWWVTTDAVLTGAWCLPEEQRVAAMFVNVSDEPQETAWTCDCSTFPFDLSRAAVAEVTDQGPGEARPEPPQFHKTLKLAPRSAVVVEITPLR